MQTHYKRLQEGYKAWLDTLGYASATVESQPRQLGEFLSWLEARGIDEADQISQKAVDAFVAYLGQRPNRRKPGGLSAVHINSHIDTLAKFFRYLHLTGHATLNIRLHYFKSDQEPHRVVLSKEAIEALYQATDNSPVGMRDRAMLAVYYGCGLRRKEGLALEVADVLFERRLLYVRQAKNNYERYVPISARCLGDLETYLYTARPLLISDESPGEALFISERGRPVGSETFICRLRALREKSGHPELIEQTFGLHALRHSIATHLLQAGMALENIARFLGHRTLDSTQIYTHIVNNEL